MRITSYLPGLLTAVTVASSAWALPIHTGFPGVDWEVAFGSNPAALAVVETTLPANWVHLPQAQWVGSTANDGSTAFGGLAAPGVYVYTLSIGTLVNSGGSFTLQYASDNTVAWSVTNGSLSGETSCNQLNCFSSGRTLTGTFSKDSILKATVVNGDYGLNPTGLAVSGEAFASPEPASYAMMGLGAVLLIRMRGRRREL